MISVTVRTIAGPPAAAAGEGNAAAVSADAAGLKAVSTTRAATAAVNPRLREGGRGKGNLTN
ncbi:hypothetical protein [Streptomyces sp. NPDC003554]